MQHAGVGAVYGVGIQSKAIAIVVVPHPHTAVALVRDPVDLTVQPSQSVANLKTSNILFVD